MKLKVVFNNPAKIADEGRPKQALSADQMPEMVEDPITGKMVPYKGTGKVKDATDDDKVRLYQLLQKFVPRYLKSWYPTYEGSAEDAASDIYANAIQYKRLDWFDKSKSTFEGFVDTLARQGVAEMLKNDETLEKGEDGKYHKVTSVSSLDDVDDEGNSRVAGKLASASETDANFANVRKIISKLEKLDEDSRKVTLAKISELMSSPETDANTRKELKLVLNAFKRPESTRQQYGAGSHAQSRGNVSRLNEEYPFSVPVKLQEDNKHNRYLKFKFETRQQAEEEAQKYQSVMEEKGLEFVKRVGSALYYTTKK